MARKDDEKTLAEENAELKKAVLDAAVAMYLGACGYDNQTKNSARNLAEGVATSAEFNAAIEAKRPKLRQLSEIAANLGIPL